MLRGHGRRIGRFRIERLMRRAGSAVWTPGPGAPARPTSATPIEPTQLERNFTTQAPNQVWLAQLTHIPTG